MRRAACSQSLLALFLGIASASGMTVSSTDLHDGAPVPKSAIKADCGGLNTVPGVNWADAPAQTKSFAITLYDADSRTGHGWWHWILIDIPATVTTVQRGFGVRTLPVNVMALPNDFGVLGYSGPCPEAGQQHRYILTVWALPTATLPFTRTDMGLNVEPYLRKNAIATATLTAVQ